MANCKFAIFKKEFSGENLNGFFFFFICEYYNLARATSWKVFAILRALIKRLSAMYYNIVH